MSLQMTSIVPIAAPIGLTYDLLVPIAAQLHAYIGECYLDFYIVYSMAYNCSMSLNFGYMAFHEHSTTSVMSEPGSVP